MFTPWNLKAIPPGRGNFVISFFRNNFLWFSPFAPKNHLFSVHRLPFMLDPTLSALPGSVKSARYRRADEDGCATCPELVENPELVEVVEWMRDLS
jgi:hypothetical protein